MRRAAMVCARVGVAVCALMAVALGLAACGASRMGKRPLPGVGRPAVTVGDKNTPEEFVLGQLYALALGARGYSVVVNRNIGTTSVALQALTQGQLSMYPEYLDVWNTEIAGDLRQFRSPRAAVRAARRYASAHGMRLLAMTPFSDTVGLGVLRTYANRHDVHTMLGLHTDAPYMTFGSPPQFADAGLLRLERAYDFRPGRVVSIDIGSQYQQLDQGTLQASYVNTTDGQLMNRGYLLLGDPRAVLGWGNVVPVVTPKVLAAEGPAFARTIDAVSHLLTRSVMRRLNAEVVLSNLDPTVVAQTFLEAHHLVPRTGTP